MPIKLKRKVLQVKNPDTGEYVEVDSFSDSESYLKLSQLVQNADVADTNKVPSAAVTNDLSSKIQINKNAITMINNEHNWKTAWTGQKEITNADGIEAATSVCTVAALRNAREVLVVLHDAFSGRCQTHFHLILEKSATPWVTAASEYGSNSWGLYVGIGVHKNTGEVRGLFCVNGWGFKQYVRGVYYRS